MFCIFRSFCRISEGLVRTPPAAPATSNHTCHSCQPSGGPHKPTPHPPPLSMLIQNPGSPRPPEAGSLPKTTAQCEANLSCCNGDS